MKKKQSTTRRFLNGRVQSLAIGLVGSLLTLNPLLASPFDATPADNNKIAAAQGALMGAHIGSIVGGIIAPGWFGTGFELAAMATDIGLKNTPPIFNVPGSFSRFPNTAPQGSLGNQACVYRFDSTIRRGEDILGDGYTSGVEESFASLFYVPFDPLDQVFADLGKPSVYHVQADVRVRATNPYLGAQAYSDYSGADQRLLQQRPEFPAGRHAVRWEATTSMNAVLDIGVPAALIPIGVAAEGYAAKKVAAAAAKRAAKGLTGPAKKPAAYYGAKLALIAADLGLIAGDVSGIASGASWYEATSFDTASNRATQSLTVWDNALPYVRDLNNNASPVTSQDIEIEATDFGGVRLGRVLDDLRAGFEAVDPCGESFDIASLSPTSRLFPIGGPEELEWDIRERDGGPYHAAMGISSNQTRVGPNNEQIAMSFTQRVRVVDTQAPILIPPAGFARYDEDGIDLTTEAFPLGRPRVVDLADPSPTVSNDAPDMLPGPPDGADGVRYEITWDAFDDTGNSARAQSADPASFVQTVTLKRPGKNTVPSAVAPPMPAEAITAKTVDIWLQGIDTDMIDGRVDPLEFEIDEFPENGQFDAPLYPYFIEDFRLTPVGEREEGDNLTRVSPLRHLADEFRLADRNTHGTFLKQRICQAAPGSLEEQEFGGVIPVNMVYEPSYVHVDDDGFYYILDKYYVCGETKKNNSDHHGELNPIPRLSKWTEVGTLVATTPLYFTDDPNDNDQHLNDNLRPADRFSVDNEDRLWVRWNPIISFFDRTDIFYSYDKNLGDVRFHGSINYSETETILGEGLRDVSSDTGQRLLYQMIRDKILVRDLDQPVSFADDSTALGELDVSGIAATASGGFGQPIRHIGNDIVVDRDGNVYVLDGSRNRVHKWLPTVSNGQGGWEFGAYVGWMGSCTVNKTIDGTPTGVPYNACDEATGTSHGYACADAKCERAADTAGSGPGQFDSPASIEVDPGNILYIADTGNLRVQRFGQDGSFAGEASSTGSGINQGDEPGFILGNMGPPKYLSVNSTAFFVIEPHPDNGDNFVHVFKTLPFREVTESRAMVRYVSDFNFQGNDFFTFKVGDGIDESEPVRVDVSVTRAFRPPERLRSQCFVANDLTSEIPCSLSEDGAIYIRLSASDPDGFISDFPNGLDTHTFEIVDDVRHGRRILDDPALEQDNSITFLYNPDPNYHGTDSLRFRVFDGAEYSEEDAVVNLTILPVPDPVVVEFDDDLRAARGFPSIVKADFSDADEEPDQQPAIQAFEWGDGVVAVSHPGTAGLWFNSGRDDLNGREIRPQIDFGRGSGLLVGSHDYDTTGTYTVKAVLDHHPSDGLPTIEYSANVDVVDVTVVGIAMDEPAADITPDLPFPLELRLENLQPSSWDGLVADDVSIAFDVPEGLLLTNVDTRCNGSARIVCDLGTLTQGKSTTVAFLALLPIAAARDDDSYSLLIDISDAGPKLMPENSATLSFDVADSDDDGIIDADDAFPDDARYADDSDGDGLPDQWERNFGFDPDVADDVTADVDGDGFTLLDEFINGSFPLRADREATISADRIESPDNNAEDAFGLQMAGADLNRDGFDDLLIGAQRYDTTGAVFVSWGTANGATTALTAFRPVVGGVMEFGRVLATGDWDDNDFPDVAIAATNGVAIHWNNGELLEVPDRVIVPPVAGATGLLSGDLDDDGRDDLLIATDNGSGGTRMEFYLSGNGGLDAAPVIIDRGDGTWLRYALADIDGDGATDLVAGHPSLAVQGYLAADNDWTAATGLVTSFQLAAPAGQSSFGSAIATGGDVTGDGIVDLVVGAYGGGGFVNLFSSESAYWNDIGATPLQTIAGAPVSAANNGTHGDQLGVSLALADLDSDGLADLVVGANRAGPADEGQLRILRGSAAGFVDEQVENGTTTYDLLGHNVAIPGDLDGDGFADVAGGASDVFTAQNPTPDGGYVQLYYHRFDPLTAGDDDDNDGVGAAVDNCASDANTNQDDIDGDGAGDACDDDIDGDGLANESDNCPVDASLDLSDFDGDFDGDICDFDDDNDSVADVDDAFPFDAKYSADSDGDGMADSWETDNGLDPDDAGDAMADLDGDGKINRDEFESGSDVAVDDVTPELTAPAGLVVDSIGPWTPVALGSANANDFKDGALDALADRASPFRPGRHVVNWTAADAAGNSADASQQVDVIPQVGFIGDTLLAAEGQQANILLALNGDAVSYPVTVPYTLSGSAEEGSDFILSTGDVIIDSSNIGTISLETLPDAAAENEETLLLTLGAPQNAVAGAATAFEVRIADGNRAPQPRLSIEQGGQRVTTVTRDGGVVEVTADPADANVADTHVFNWNATDNALVPGEGYSQATFSFDPLTIAEGVYRVTVDVTDNGSPAATARQYRYLRVVATLPAFTPGTDSDGDGIDDVDEALRDSNDNGASDYLDPAFVSHHVVAREGGNALLQTGDGLTLGLGRVALATGDDAMVSMMDIASYGDAGGAAANGSDTRFSYSSGLFDFEISELPAPGHTVRVVIPQMAPLADGTSYRKYVDGQGWSTFEEDAKNALYSAAGEAGICPAPGSNDYVPGLGAGHYCVQLLIEDGGPNDADGEANRVIRDPGGAATLAQPAAIGASARSTPDRAVSNGDSNVVMLRFSLDSNSSDVVLNDLTLDASGTGNDASDVSRVRLWVDLDGDGKPGAADPEIGSGQYDGNNASLTLTMATPYTLDAGTTDFIVSYDF